MTKIHSATRCLIVGVCCFFSVLGKFYILLMIKEDTIMCRKMLCCLLAFALVLALGGVKVILPVKAEPISGEGMDTITMQNEFTDDAVMVVMTHEASLQFVDYIPTDFPEIDCAEIVDLSSAKGAKVQAVLYGEQLDMASTGARFMNQNIDIEGFHRVLCLKLANPGKGNVLRAIMALEQRDDVYLAEPNYIISPMGPVLPDDLPVYGWAATKIEQEAAWEIETGSASVLVGVVDTGIDANHPELRNIVNTTLSRDFTGDGYLATQDRTGHGTHVAGIIAAKYNNDDWNFSGVCQNVTLVSLRVISPTAQTNCQTVANAINHAEESNIPILNLSLDSKYEKIDSLQTAINNYDGLLVCSIGNAGVDSDVYGGARPAVLPNSNVISVGASTANDTKCDFSNYGKTALDLFAPGDNIVSCYPQALCAASGCSSENHVRYGYHKNSGTSMAAPFVTGVAALILAHNPYVMRSTIKSVLISSVDHIDAFSDICVSGGRLNAVNALSHSSAHGNIACTYVNAAQHRCICQDCGITWMEDHDIHPGLGTCTRCYLITN